MFDSSCYLLQNRDVDELRRCKRVIRKISYDKEQKNFYTRPVMSTILAFVEPKDLFKMQFVSTIFYDKYVPLGLPNLLTEYGRRRREINEWLQMKPIGLRKEVLDVWNILPPLNLDTIEYYFRPELGLGKSRIEFEDTKISKWKNRDNTSCSGMLKNARTAHGVMRMIPTSGQWIAEKTVYEGSNSGLNRAINDDGSIDLYMNIAGTRKSWLIFDKFGQQSKNDDPDGFFTDDKVCQMLGQELWEKVLRLRVIMAGE